MSSSLTWHPSQGQQNLFFFQAIIHFTIDNAIIQEFGACLAQNIGSRAALTQNGS